ncbi:dTDP-4-dehydrorhamnose reductase [Ralstonia sp. 24A2]|uniref:dTDP-4-dehydrorhamnose reductase n=1 Tax=Ralstonia sp. 24A2 TaxID=3447364 RepID=UPI003F69EEE0
MKRILLTGCRGQLGTALIAELNGLGELIATDRQFLDVRDSGAMRRVLLDRRPDVIVNAAAFTAVDRAESQYAEAEAVNAVAPAILANIARSIGSTLVHFSTDYVFSGSLYAPYREAHRPRPLSVYGKTKLAGEEAIRQSGCQHLIFRTGWLMSMTKPNFIQFVLDKLIGGQAFPIIEQWGAPTSATWLARVAAVAVRRMLSPGGFGMPETDILHASSSGCVSRQGLVEYIAAQATRLVPDARDRARNLPQIVGLAHFGARRPAHAVLDCSRLQSILQVVPPSWQSVVDEILLFEMERLVRRQ